MTTPDTHIAIPKPTVLEALAACMTDVQAIAKGDRNTQQNYSFRGIDAVVNAVGPVLRRHGVIVVPTQVRHDVEHYTTAKGTPMRGVTLIVDFRFYGPAGDFIDAQAAGEASDSGDKATPKAHSVAYRTLLLQALCIPTHEPDPDSESHERATPPAARQQKKAAASFTASVATEAQRTRLLELAALLQDQLTDTEKQQLAHSITNPTYTAEMALAAIDYLEKMVK